jgi:hypothetical protein
MMLLAVTISAAPTRTERGTKHHHYLVYEPKIESGTGTGKTAVVFDWVSLRAL